MPASAHKLGLALLCLAPPYFTPLPAKSQTCSCAAVPLLGSMQSTSTEPGQWFVGTTYEFHDVGDLVAGSSSIPDGTGRERTSRALIVEASRGFGERWSVAAMSALVDHQRRVGTAGAEASGLSDAIVMARYAVKRISLYSDTAIAFGIGAKLPLGKDDATIRGVALAEDMQPSTGATGGTVWGYWARALNDSRRTRVYASATVSTNGDNDRLYRFGDDTVLTFGSALQTSGPWGFNLALAYRNAERDRRNSTVIPNTGGEWLDLSLAAQYNLSESLAVGIATRMPIARDLHDELQFTSNYAVRISMSYVFGERR